MCGPISGAFEVAQLQLGVSVEASIAAHPSDVLNLELDLLAGRGLNVPMARREVRLYDGRAVTDDHLESLPVRSRLNGAVQTTSARPGGKHLKSSTAGSRAVRGRWTLIAESTAESPRADALRALARVRESSILALRRGRRTLA